MFAVFFGTLLVNASQAGAVEAIPFQPSANLPISPIIVSGYSFSGPNVSYVQLYNTSEEPVDITGLKLSYKIMDQTNPVEVAELSGWIAPLNYVIAANLSAVSNADFPYTAIVPTTVTSMVSSVRLKSSGYADVVVTLGEAGAWQRKVSPATGKYVTGYEIGSNTGLKGLGRYVFPMQTSLQFSEILPNSRNCSPLETNGDCTDYVKLYNSSNQVIDMSEFRLRNGYLGQNATASNTFNLVGDIEPGHYAIFPVGITNSVSWVWLEDTYGVKRYDSTVQDYPDASADSRKGQAWAYDETDGTWKWTVAPQPYDSPSIFPVLLPAPILPVSTLVPCKDTQYRSEETNRCRTIVTAISLTACQDGQYRSEETNRCRSVISAISSLVACSEEQERNPLTNRCRTIASTVNSLVPCNENQERNVETNRCRNVVKSVPSTAFAVEPVKEGSKAFIGWWALGGVGVLAGGYGVWEWRREMAGAIRKVAAFFISSK